ncbi:MAG: CPBP family intramembrane metalloprotease [Oscillospiraceae bacterium]|nr:CPBP family intramembrane metalloprotease [Oscillospiraceae bacterium]
MTKTRNLTVGKIIAYCLIFFAIWSVRELIIRPFWLNQFDGLTWHILESSMKLLVWTLPAILLIKYFQDDMWISLKEMFTTKPRWFKGAPILSIIIIVPVLQALIFGGGLAIRPDFVPLSLIQGVMFAGITEDIVFRGFLLNAFLKKMKTWQAVALDAVLFYLIHVPIWIYQGNDLGFFLSASVTVMGLSAIFAYSFIKTKNIFVPIVLHMIWNLLVMTLYMG